MPPLMPRRQSKCVSAAFWRRSSARQAAKECIMGLPAATQVRRHDIQSMSQPPTPDIWPSSAALRLKLTFLKF